MRKHERVGQVDQTQPRLIGHRARSSTSAILRSCTLPPKSKWSGSRSARDARRPLTVPVLPGQPPAVQRGPHEHAEPVPRTSAAPPARCRGRRWSTAAARSTADMAPPVGHPLRLDQQFRRERRRPEGPDLPGVHEVGQRADRLVQIGVGIGPVDLVQVDPVGARRRRLSSTARTIQRREAPRWFGSSPMALKNFVARMTASRRPRRARPTISSDSPNAYMSAVSMKLMPASSAVWTMAAHSSSSRLPQAPSTMVPRQKVLTCMPVRPRVRYSTVRVRRRLRRPAVRPGPRTAPGRHPPSRPLSTPPPAPPPACWCRGPT